jgi:uncharacterized protein (TIGR00304 family)
MLVRASGLILIVSSALLLIFAAISGDLELTIIFIIPVITGSGLIPALGGILLFFGIMLLFLSFMMSYDVANDGISVREVEPWEMEKKRKKRFGGVILVGPIPIVFGSDRGMALWVVVIAIICLIAISLSIFLWSK